MVMHLRLHGSLLTKVRALALSIIVIGLVSSWDGSRLVDVRASSSISPATGRNLLWSVQASPTIVKLTDISCATPLNCFAVGESATVVKTDNGGKTWKTVTTPYGLRQPAALYSSVRCPAAGVCSVIAAPNVVLRTTDDGKTWHSRVVKLPATLAGLGRIACPGRNVCYATASPSGPTSTWFTHSAAIYKTADGNGTWHRLSIPTGVPCPGDCTGNVGFDLQWISCQNDLHCRAGGDTFIGSHEGYASAVLSTGNGGTTWALVHHSFDANIATCPTVSICTGVFYQPLTPNTGPYLMRTTNGGSVWSSRSIKPVLTSIACTGASFCELAGPGGKLAMTINSKLFVQKSPTMEDLTAVACPRANACYVVGSGGTILDRNSTTRAAAGAWSVQASGTSQALYSVACFDALRCKAVGAAGSILFTRDGGKTWRRQSNPLAGTSTILYRIACMASKTCYVIGRPNIVLVTHNGGAGWSVHRISLPETTDLADTNCVDRQVYDLRGRPALCRLGLLDLACTGASTCFVVASLGVQEQFGNLAPAVFLTTNGGGTWKRQTIPETAPCQGDCGPAGVRVPYPLEWVTCGPGSLCRAGGATFIGSHPGYGTLVIAAKHPGAPWAPLKQNPTNGQSSPAPDAAVCTTVKTCYGVWTTSPFQPGNEIWHSTDGGWTWQGMSSGSPKLRNAIACPGAGTCYSVGNQGTITASTKGGPFLAQLSQTSHDLYGVTCIGLKKCFAVGNKGTIVAREKL